MIDLTIQQEQRERGIQRAKEQNIVIPTFVQMKNPELTPDSVKQSLSGTGLWDLKPENLFRITWKNEPIASGVALGM